jgi:hypothetical protein
MDLASAGHANAGPGPELAQVALEAMHAAALAAVASAEAATAAAAAAATATPAAAAVEAQVAVGTGPDAGPPPLDAPSLATAAGHAASSRDGWAAVVAACCTAAAALQVVRLRPGAASTHASIHSAAVAVVDACLAPASLAPRLGPDLLLTQLYGLRCLDDTMQWAAAPSSPMTSEAVAGAAGAVGPVRWLTPCVPAFMRPEYWGAR